MSVNMTPKSIRDIHYHNVRTLRQRPLAEISGALGDLGTFLPIVIALTINKSISLPTTLIFTGIFNILTGVFFGIPLPVQPMKAIAAVAISQSFSAGEITAAGIFVASCIFIFSITGLLRWFAAAIPIPVVKGIQVGAGLSLILVSGTKVLSSLSWTSPSWADNYLWTGFAFLFLLYINTSPRTPYALIVFILGIVFAVIRLSRSDHGALPSLRFWHPYTVVPKGRDWEVGAVDAGIGQLPLTTLNSIIAVSHLSADLLPSMPALPITSLGLSVAGMNLVSCWFGAMPVCHGSGGLAAQYKFGARSGASIILLGAFKLLVGLIFGESLVDLLEKFPVSLLAVMVIAAGLELASVGESLNTARARDIQKTDNSDGHTEGVMRSGISEQDMSESERKRRWSVMIVTIAGLIALKNDAIGFIAGMLCHWSYKLPELWSSWHDQRNRARRSSQSGFGNNEPLLPQREETTR